MYQEVGAVEIELHLKENKGECHVKLFLKYCSKYKVESGFGETLHFHFHALEKEMATFLQCSCLETPRDGGAWWAAVYGVAQSWTRLKRLSSSSNTVLRRPVRRVL